MAYGNKHNDREEVLYAITAEDIHNYLEEQREIRDYSPEMFDRICDEFLSGSYGTADYINEHLSDWFYDDFNKIIEQEHERIERKER